MATRQKQPPERPEELLHALRQLQQHRYHHSQRQYAPHKPLFLLLALGQLAGGHERFPFGDVEPTMRRLLLAFAPPTAGQLSPEDPFWHLRSDGKTPRTASLRAAEGTFPDAVRALFAEHPTLVHAAAALLLETYFAPSLHEDIRAVVRLPPLQTFQAPILPDWWSALRPRRPRDPDFRPTVLDHYENACAVCGLNPHMDARPSGLEAAHVHWHAYEGPDALHNGLALCPLHHAALDRGWIGIDDQLQVVVSSRLTGGEAVERFLGRYHGRALREPAGALGVDPRVWHQRQIFKRPAREG
jgi:putative restriction endonuclease